MKNRIIFALLGLAITTPALATSDLHVRTVAGANPSCSGYSLVEQVWEGGSVMGSWVKYRLFCLKDASNNHAHWVVAADVKCGGPKPGACDARSQTKAFDEIKTLTAHAGQAGTQTLRFEKALLGKECIRRRGVWKCTDGLPQKPGFAVTINAKVTAETGNTDDFADVADSRLFTLDTSR